jgi:hypothetical protein
LPAPIYPEMLDDAPAPLDAAAPQFRVAAPLATIAAGAADPREFIAAAAGIAVTNALRERADAIHAAARGSLTTFADGKTVPVKDISADDFWKALNEGGVWTGEAEPPGPPPKPPLHKPAAQLPAADSLAVVNPERGLAASPLTSKLYRESNLRLAANRVAMHPSDARARGLEEGARALLLSEGGQRAVEITHDAGVQPGVVLAVSGAVQAKVVRA